tara:strand:- start:4241 stop:5191 length:951 start_codon:yes stop_codon:yes gene_type:complete
MTLRLLSILSKKIRSEGILETMSIIIGRLTGKRLAGSFPLNYANRASMFTTSSDVIRQQEKRKMRQSSFIVEASQVEDSYPEIFQSEKGTIRYSFLSAKQESKGLVVLFHGHNAYLHMGPMVQWDYFDILAPWDTFGWHRQGSWFWGEKGKNDVEWLVHDLIEKYKSRSPNHYWFCMGGSMGGFGALYHGIKYGCHGIYVQAPQVDLKLKVIENGENNRDNPYGYLAGENLDKLPNLLQLSETKENLPPLFLMQHQFDPVNYFVDHGFRLLDVYNRKKSWYGVRVHPSIGHGGDGSQTEAQYFFKLIVDKKPPIEF